MLSGVKSPISNNKMGNNLEGSLKNQATVKSMSSLKSQKTRKSIKKIKSNNTIKIENGDVNVDHALL